MPRSITKYRIFIGSPQGLEEERKSFRGRLNWFSQVHGPDGDVEFEPVSWEETVGGIGRPQSHINEDLRQCDYAVFVLHDRWGSSPGGGFTSGTSEEFHLAEQLHEQGKIKDIALLFKQIEPARLSDPGDQLKAVIHFKNRIENEKRYLFSSYSCLDEFKDLLWKHLASWRRHHIKMQASLLPPRVRLGELEQPSLSRSRGNWKQLGSEEQLGLVVVRNSRAAEYASFTPA